MGFSHRTNVPESTDTEAGEKYGDQSSIWIRTEEGVPNAIEVENTIPSTIHFFIREQVNMGVIFTLYTLELSHA